MSIDEINNVKGLLHEIYGDRLEYKEGKFLIYDDIEKKYVPKDNAILIQQIGVELNYDALGFGINKDPQIETMNEVYLGQQLGFGVCSGNILGNASVNIYFATNGLNIMSYYCDIEHIEALTTNLTDKLKTMKENINKNERERLMFITSDEPNGGVFFYLVIKRDENDDVIIKI